MNLTKRQAQILEWIQKGLSNKHIAQRLGISDSTVKLHVSALLKKFAVQNRQQLALYSLNNVVPVLPQVEQTPYAWVKATDKYVGITFSDPAIDGWTPVYRKAPTNGTNQESE